MNELKIESFSIKKSLCEKILQKTGFKSFSYDSSKIE